MPYKEALKGLFLFPEPTQVSTAGHTEGPEKPGGAEAHPEDPGKKQLEYFEGSESRLPL
jgi:hypothetical protein